MSKYDEQDSARWYSQLCAGFDQYEAALLEDVATYSKSDIRALFDLVENFEKRADGSDNLSLQWIARLASHGLVRLVQSHVENNDLQEVGWQPTRSKKP